MLSKRQPSISNLFFANIILVLICSFFLFPKAFLPGYDLSGLDTLGELSPWNIEEYNVKPQNPLLLDIGAVFIPFDKFTFDTLHQNGTIPFWNHNNACGQPFMANMISAVFYPISLVSSFFPHPYLVKAILKLIICQLGMFFFLRQLSINLAGTIAGSLLFTFSAFTMLWLNHPQSNVSILLPGLFCFWTKYLNTGKERYFFITAFFVMFQLLGGHPETAFQSGILIFFFTLFFPLIKNKSQNFPRYKSLLMLVSVYIIGLSLSLFQILPFLYYLDESTALHIRQLIDPFNTLSAAIQIEKWQAIIGLITPKLFGSPIDSNYFGPLNFNEINSGFIGLTGLFFAFCFGKILKNSFKNTFILILIVSLYFVYKIPIISSILYVYPLVLIPHCRMLLGVSFCLACLAALGIHDFIEVLREKKKYFLRLFIFSFMVGLILFFNHYFSEYPIALFQYKTIIIEQFLPFLLITLIVLPIIYHLKSLRVIAIIITIIIELTFFSKGYIPASKSNILKTTDPAIELLKTDKTLFRVAGQNTNILFPNTNILFNIQVPVGFDAIGNKRYYSFLQTISKFLPHRVVHHINWAPTSNIEWLSFLNIKYIITYPGYHIDHSAFKKIYPLKNDNTKVNFFIFKNINVLPRAYLVSHISGAKDFETAQTALKSKYFNPRTSVVIENSDSFQFPLNEKKDEEYCRIKQYDSEKVVIEVKNSKPRAIVISDSWSSGWKAKIDGIETKIYKANLAFRGMFINKSGTHEIVMEYTAPGFFPGLIVFTLMLIGIIGILFFKKQT